MPLPAVKSIDFTGGSENFILIIPTGDNGGVMGVSRDTAVFAVQPITASGNGLPAESHHKKISCLLMRDCNVENNVL